MSNKTILRFLFAAILTCIGLLYNSCRKEKSGPAWDVDLLVPLVNSTLSIDQVLPDSLLYENPDNSLDIVYKTGLYSFSSDTLFRIPNTSLDTAYWLPFPVTLAPGSTIVPATTEETKSTTGTAQLTTATLLNGIMTLQIRSQVKSMLDFTYRIPSAISPYGMVFDTTIRIPAATAIKDGIYSATFDLSGYRLDLTGAAGNKANTVVTYHTAVVSPAPYGVNLTVDPGDSIVISNTFSGITCRYARGYFGSDVTAVGPESNHLSLFSHIIDGTLDLEKINIDLNIENSVGADARVTIKNLSSVNTRKNTTVALTHAIIGSPINLNRAVDQGGNVMPSAAKFSIKPSNSNIKAFVENLPDRMSYQLELGINPKGNVSGSNDFIYYDKLLKTELNMTIPLSLIANNLTLADTVGFNLGKEADNVNHGYLYLYAENGFPFSAQAQVYVMNENFSVVDSLVSAPNTILPPSLDANYVCVGTRQNKLSIPVSEAKMALLRSAKQLYLKMKFNTAGQPNYVKIYSSYKMNVRMVGDFNYTVGKK